MSTLIIDNKSLSLSQQYESIKIKKKEENPQTIPFSHITRIIISSNVKIESRLLRTLASKDISVAFINPRKPCEYGLLQGNGHNDAQRRIRQMQASLNNQTCNQISHYLVIEKIQQQIQMLNNAAPNYEQCRYAIQHSLPVLNSALKKLEQHNNPLNSVRGLEGSAAASYFKAYRCLFPESYEFTHRNRRPPKDPINALLSLSYTLANSLASQQIQIAGYDLHIGFYHQLSYSRHSLSSDIIEPVRPIIDEWVRQLIAEQHLRQRHFKKDGDACYLKKDARQIYYKKWEQDMREPLSQQLKQTLKIISDMIGLNDE